MLLSSNLRESNFSVLIQFREHPVVFIIISRDKKRVTVTTFHGRIIICNNITTKLLITANFKGNRCTFIIYHYAKNLKL